MRLLVFGASGFIGTHVLQLFKEASGVEVHAVSTKKGREGNAANWHWANIFDRESIQAVLHAAKPTHLLHLAWCTEHGAYWDSEDNYRWLKASNALFEDFLDVGGKRIVCSGTSAEYSANENSCDEHQSQCRPATLYGRSKLQLSQELARLAARGGITHSWARIFNPFGPGEDRRRLVSSTINSLLRGENARCTTGEQVRDFLYVKDVASAIGHLLMGTISGPVNVCSGRPLAVKEMVRIIAEEMGMGEAVELGAIPNRSAEVPFVVGSNARLTRECGWREKYGTRAGVSETIEWWKKQLKVK